MMDKENTAGGLIHQLSEVVKNRYGFQPPRTQTIIDPLRPPIETLSKKADETKLRKVIRWIYGVLRKGRRFSRPYFLHVPAARFLPFPNRNLSCREVAQRVGRASSWRSAS